MSLAAVLGPLGVPELLIIAFIVVLVFGVGRLPEVGGALGKGIREFRKSTKDIDDDRPTASLDAGAPMSPPVADVSPAGETRFCGECGARNARTAKFCAECGHSMGVLAS
jgi:sec-independent protein translocase protein TatA